MGKLRTKEQQDKATNTRLLKTYGITLIEYNQILEEQNGVCKICQKPPTNRRLHTDHDHAMVRQKIDSKKLCLGNWLVWVSGMEIKTIQSTKSKGLAIVRSQLKRRSVRGLLCAWCNRGLRYYHDDYEILASASQYIKTFTRSREPNKQGEPNVI